MARVITTKKGKRFTLLNPAEKGRKYADELGSGYRQTNDGELKEKNGKPLTLSKAQRAYRAGYLKARADNAKAFKYNKKK